MGQRTQEAIAAFQSQPNWRTLLTPAHGSQADALEQLSTLAIQLFHVIELERSGERDGDGNWYGSDPLGSLVHQIAEVFRSIQQERTQEGGA